MSGRPSSEGVDVFGFNPQEFLLLDLRFWLRREKGKADLGDITHEKGEKKENSVEGARPTFAL